MDIYLLDAQFNRYRVISEFESFIWTDRYDSYGDFELTIHNDFESRMLNPSRYIAFSESNTFMIIETREDFIDGSGQKMSKISGRSMSSFLDRRVAYGQSLRMENWVSENTPGEVLKSLISFHCIYGSGISTDDIVPELYVANLDPSTRKISVSLPKQSLYEAVQKIAESADLGFEVQLTSSSPRLRFRIYSGVDRSNSAVFSSDLDTLSEEHYIDTTRDYKNVAYVWSKDGRYRSLVPAPGSSIYRSGLDRRVLYVDGSDLDLTPEMNPEYRVSVLQQRGLEEIVKHKRVRAFDGKITPPSPYRFGVNYYLGDIVGLRSMEGDIYKVRVKEHIWSMDSSGVSSYPTFVANSEG